MAIVIPVLAATLIVVAAVALLAVGNVIVQGPQSAPGGTLRPHHFSPLLTVTPPVAFEIAENLRRHQSAERIHRIEQRAHRNLEALTSEAVASVDSLCPLKCEDDSCAAAPGSSGDCLSQCPLFSDSLNPDACHVDNGLSSALSSAGLDGHRYELNAALEVALKTPDAATRWARGDNVFAGCRQFDV